MPNKSYLRAYIPIEKTHKNNKVKYLSKGKRLTKKNESRINNLYIPPAYNDLLFAKSPNNKVQVIGYDINGRRQYIYNSNYTKNIEKRKYNKLQTLVPIISKIEEDSQTHINNIYNNIYQTEIKNTYLDKKNLNNVITDTTEIMKYNLGLSKNELIQIIIFLLILTNLRIGCMKYYKLYNSFGLTTLLPDHIDLSNYNNVNNNNSCKLQFIGKKGVENTAIINDNKIIYILNYMLKRVKHIKKQFPEAKHLFQYVYYNPIANIYNLAIISSSDIMNYFKNNYNTDITPKMFRTWYANYHMFDYIYKISTDKPEILSQLQNKKGTHLHKYLKKEIPIYVSQKLNNTPNICKKKYINNALFNNIIQKPNYYIKKINESNNITKLLQSILTK